VLAFIAFLSFMHNATFNNISWRSVLLVEETLFMILDFRLAMFSNIYTMVFLVKLVKQSNAKREIV
jgi:hypothetical protein